MICVGFLYSIDLMKDKRFVNCSLSKGDIFFFQCNILNEKLESLLITLNEEAQASTQVSKDVKYPKHPNPPPPPRNKTPKINTSTPNTQGC